MQSHLLIDELQESHEAHVKKLKELHENDLAHLQSKLKKCRQECERMEQENSELRAMVEGTGTEIEMLRQSFDLVQGRLKRVLVDQDDLVRLLQLAGNLDDTTKSRNYSYTIKARELKEIEAQLKARDDGDHNLSVKSALQAIKYFKKLESSDPVHLCRLLEIPFCPDRSFSLSTSLLSSIAVHMADDVSASAYFDANPMYPVLLNEIVRLRQEINELSRCLVGCTPVKGIQVTLGKRIEDRSFKGTIAKWLIEEHVAATTRNNHKDQSNASAIFSAFFSNFK